MVESIIQFFASALAWAAAKGLDAILGKWLAYFTIAFEQSASDKAKASFNEAITQIKANSPEKAQAWEDWRKRAAQS